MVEALKKLDKKFLIISGCIFLIPILIIIFLAIIQGCNAKITYEKYEENMIKAAEKYINNKNKIPTKEGELKKIKLDNLVKGGYIKSPEKALGDSSCKGKVSVRRNGASIEITDGGFLNYTVDLSCDSYKTIRLVDKITETVVAEESGLYKMENEYIFRGNKVKNHVIFFDHEYRIISIDENNIIKLVKSDSSFASRQWDNKYNVNINSSYGKNIYKDSVILSYLIADYQNPKNINKKAKSHVVAYDVCTGKRRNDDYSLNKQLDCSEKLEKQVVSIMNVSDFAMASTDPDCNSIISKSCNNYNYLFDIGVSGWTLNSSSENSYEVFSLIGGLVQHQKASTYNKYNLVIYIDGNEKYTSGTGSSIDPYVLN